MKLLTLFLLLSVNLAAQVQKSTFVRVYDAAGNKIYKGRVLAVTDSSIQLKSSKAAIEVAVAKIGMIKTKHSAGNNVLVGSLMGASSLALIAAASADENDFILNDAGESAAAGGIAGMALGGVAGLLTVPLKNSKTFPIGGSASKWKAFKAFMEGEK